MIGRLRGLIIEKKTPQILLEACGVGYEVQLPPNCFCSLPEIGREATIFTHFVVRNNTQLLFGFLNKQEQVVFRALIKLNGIGPKLALAILSEVSVREFVNIIINQNKRELTQLSGIGRKTAERLLVEMKDKFNDPLNDLYSLQDIREIDSNKIKLSNTENEAIAALITLGYKPRKAHQMIKEVFQVGVNCETLVRNALQNTI